MSQHMDPAQKSLQHFSGSQRTKLAGLFPITAAHANFTTLLYFFTKGVAVSIRLYRYHGGPVHGAQQSREQSELFTGLHHALGRVGMDYNTYLVITSLSSANDLV